MDRPYALLPTEIIFYLISHFSHPLHLRRFLDCVKNTSLLRILRCSRTPKIEIYCWLRKCNRAISFEKFHFQSMSEHACMNPYKYYAWRKCKQNVQLAPTEHNTGGRPYLSVAIRNRIFVPYSVCIAFCGETFLRVFFQQLSQLVGVYCFLVLFGIFFFSENTSTVLDAGFSHRSKSVQ